MISGRDEREAPCTIGWANIYSVPIWMKQTEGTIKSEVDALKGAGLVEDLMITDVQGNAQIQIQQIQSMIDADAIVCAVCRNVKCGSNVVR